MDRIDEGTRQDVDPGGTPGFLRALALEENFRRLPEAFYTLLPPEKVGVDPVLVHANPKAAALIGLDPSTFADPAFARIFSGHEPIAGFAPLASVYAGHQFGVWVPQLGDGRALLIAQVRNARGELWDVQLKGAGRTPYSRFADGRAVMRSTIREYLGSEALAALGVPTTRALAIVATREGVRREEVEPGAVLTRLSPSHVRFGHFEFFHHSGRPELVRALADHVIAEHFPALVGQEDRYARMCAEVVQRTADLLAQWQAVGFAHGVMNTDNMSILGLAIDYGPYGFLDAFDPGFVCNHSDDHGRYAFDKQPAIALWNLRALASALTSLIDKNALIAALNGFAPRYVERFLALMRAKLGLEDVREEDEALIGALFAAMAKGEADYTLAFRRLSRAHESAGRDAWLALFGENARADAQAWLSDYGARSRGDTQARRARMDRVNPKYVLRNWLAETAIRAVEDEGNVAPLDRIFHLIQSPFDEHPEDEEFAAPPPEPLRALCVSCSS
jgi:hypothetical protein